MKHAIYAYPINPAATHFVVELPKGARVLEIDANLIKKGQPTLWAQIDRDETETEVRAFARYDCGESIPKHKEGDLEYLGRSIGANKSASHPGALSLRNVFWFEAHGQSRQAIIDLDQATKDALAPDDDLTPDDTGHNV